MKKLIAIIIGLVTGALSFEGMMLLMPLTDLAVLECIAVSVLVGLLICTFFISITPTILSHVKRSADKLGNQILRVPLADIMGTTLGLIVGLIIAVLLNAVIGDIPLVGPYISMALLILIPYVFTIIGHRKHAEIFSLFSGSWKNKERMNKESVESDKSSVCGSKILDTSAVIDGRILYICRAGFLEGTLIVTNLVLDELRHIADSDDVLRRAKGRRGLDTLNQLTNEFEDRVKIVDVDYPDINEVDSKLVRLAMERHGGVVTTDYNLNKVAQVQGVPVYNVNELSNAVKPVVIPGEELRVDVLKAGKEHNQGVAYLEDGTMIVVENGRSFIGQTIDTVVTSVLQTAAGRMIFVRKQ